MNPRHPDPHASPTVARASSPQPSRPEDLRLKARATAVLAQLRQARQRAVVLAVQLLATAIVVAVLVIGGAACSSTKDLGPRGDARLYLDSSWIMVYPRLELTPVPLDSRRTYVLRVAGMKEWAVGSFNLEVHTRSGRSFKSKHTNASAQSLQKPNDPVIRIRVLNHKGRVFLTETIGSGDQLWLPFSRKGRQPVLKSHVSGWKKQIPRPGEPGSDFTVIVEILRSSKIPGQYLKISGP